MLHLKKNSHKHLAARLLFILGLTFFIPQTVRATVPAWDEGAWGSIPIFVIPTIPTDPGSQQSKETSIVGLSYSGILSQIIPSWDQVAKTLAHVALNTLKQQTLTWIQNGFEGEPLFLQDPEKFFLEMADQASGVFIQDIEDKLGLENGYFCNMELQFIFDIKGFGRKDYFPRARCTITEVIDEVKDFHDDFENGRWEAFVQIQQRNNNPHGFYLASIQENERRREEVESIFQKTASYGGGYLPTMECIDGESNAVGCRKFRIKTPSKAIADRITQTVGIDYQEFISADEISEIIEALINLAVRESLESFL